MPAGDRKTLASLPCTCHVPPPVHSVCPLEWDLNSLFWCLLFGTLKSFRLRVEDYQISCFFPSRPLFPSLPFLISFPSLPYSTSLPNFPTSLPSSPPLPSRFLPFLLPLPLLFLPFLSAIELGCMKMSGPGKSTLGVNDWLCPKSYHLLVFLLLQENLFSNPYQEGEKPPKLV